MLRARGVVCLRRCVCAPNTWSLERPSPSPLTPAATDQTVTIKLGGGGSGSGGSGASPPRAGLPDAPSAAHQQSSQQQRQRRQQQYAFRFDEVLGGAADQQAVYDAVAPDLVRGALEGFNGTVMCYGQTGAGKTYTMTGDRSSFARRGLIPRVVSGLFGALREDPGVAAWRMRVTYLEASKKCVFSARGGSTRKLSDGCSCGLLPCSGDAPC